MKSNLFVMEDMIILVDENDNIIGADEKIRVHKDGKLHRAFSIFVFNEKGELLLHRRNKKKYHSGGLWTNTCCSHPREGENTDDAAHRRLKEEMGFDCELKEIFSFTYKVKFKEDLYEHEYDHVFIGRFDGNPDPDPEEVEEWAWMTLEELKIDIKLNPDKYTYWLKESINKIIDYVKKK